jgi:hypothetical protein
MLHQCFMVNSLYILCCVQNLQLLGIHKLKLTVQELRDFYIGIITRKGNLVIGSTAC